MVFAANPILKWAEKDRKRYIILLVIIDILVVAALIYTYFFVTYRMDYVSGTLLVDPQRLKYNTIVEYGNALGLINGCYLCAGLCPYNPKEASVKQRIIRGIIGAIIVIILCKFLFNYVIMNCLRIRYAISITFIMGIIITLIYPIIFTKLIKKI